MVFCLLWCIHSKMVRLILYIMKKISLVLFFALFPALSIMAQNEKDEPVYIWGASLCFNDTVVYFSEIQQLDGVALEEGTDFLPNRQFYSYELKDYMSFKEDMPGRTSVVLFSKKKQTLEKRVDKIKQRLVKKNGKTVRYLGDKFKFTKP